MTRELVETKAFDNIFAVDTSPEMLHIDQTYVAGPKYQLMNGADVGKTYTVETANASTQGREAREAMIREGEASETGRRLCVLAELPRLDTAEDVRVFLGRCAEYRPLIRNYEAMTKPLRRTLEEPSPPKPRKESKPRAAKSDVQRYGIVGAIIMKAARKDGTIGVANKGEPCLPSHSAPPSPPETLTSKA